jgi:hypothetical protein
MMKRDMIQLLVEGEIGSILKIRPADKNDNASSEIRANPAMSSRKCSFRGIACVKAHGRTKMQPGELKVLCRKIILLLASSVTMGASAICGQEPAQAAQIPAAEASQSVAKNQTVKLRQEHRFWDKKNAWLFAGVGASRALDYSSTLNLRRRDDNEILLTNDLVDNHAAFAVVEAAGTAVSIGASYLFHRSGHHKLERWTSIVHIGLTTSGAVRNYCLPTAH